MEEALQEIKESLGTLPSHIREVVTQTQWEPKIEELALKYSLTEGQKKALFTEVLLVLVAINPEEDLMENIENEVGVSGILAEQLTEEVGERIFTWIHKLYTEKEKNIKEQPLKESTLNTLDIPPPNLPGEVVEESAEEKVPVVVSTTPTATLLRDEVKDFFAQPTQQENLTPQETPVPQQPTFTPPIEQPFVPQSPRSFITQKLTQPSTLSTPPVDIPKTYSVDPYREPLD